MRKPFKQEGGLVPIVEPEVLMDGDHTIDVCEWVTTETLEAVYHELHLQGVQLEGTILKASMVISGSEAFGRAGVQEVAEATLSFLGVGAPPTQPSLGTLIRVGQGFLFSGEWWILFYPACTLLALALSVNLLGDWLRDALNPKLR